MRFAGDSAEASSPPTPASLSLAHYLFVLHCDRARIEFDTKRADQKWLSTIDLLKGFRPIFPPIPVFPVSLFPPADRSSLRTLLCPSLILRACSLFVSLYCTSLSLSRFSLLLCSSSLQLFPPSCPPFLPLSLNRSLLSPYFSPWVGVLVYVLFLPLFLCVSCNKLCFLLIAPTIGKPDISQ